MPQQVEIGRQEGQWFQVRTPDGTEFFIEAQKCRSGYVRLLVECDQSFEVRRWDRADAKGSTVDKMRSRERERRHPEGEPSLGKNYD